MLRCLVKSVQQAKERLLTLGMPVASEGEGETQTSNASHMNTIPDYGFGCDFPSPVILYYANGDVLHYLVKEPMANKYQIITDLAGALSVMHSSGPPVIHGNLKASNVLIDDDGHARILMVTRHSDFTAATVPEIRSCRWTAPEVLHPTEQDEEKPLPVSTFLTPEADVYAFGMTVLEIYTGRKHFLKRPQDLPIVAAVVKGKRPRRPESPEITDALWLLMCDCWKQDPSQRPSMAMVHERLIKSLGHG